MIDEEIQKLMKQCDNDSELRIAMKGRGMVFLADQLKDILVAHETTVDEILRVGVKEA